MRFIGGLLGLPVTGPRFIQLDVPAIPVLDLWRMAQLGAAPGNTLGFMALFLTDVHAALGTIDVQTNLWTGLNAQLGEGSRIDPGTHGLWIHRSCVSADVEANFGSASHALVRTILPGGSNSRDLILTTAAPTVNFCAVNTLPLEAQWLYAPNGSIWITRSTAVVGAVNIFHQLFMWAGVLGSTPPGAS